MKGSFVDGAKRENFLNSNLRALRADYNWLLREHEGLEQYLAENTSETTRVRNKADLLAKNFAKGIKLSGFSSPIGEAKGIKIG